jgi:hypothetical protein
MNSTKNKPARAAYLAPSIIARAGNVLIEADRHGEGFTCTIDGRPVQRLRGVTLSLELDQANLVTVAFLTGPKERS